MINLFQYNHKLEHNKQVVTHIKAICFNPILSFNIRKF